MNCSHFVQRRKCRTSSCCRFCRDAARRHFRRFSSAWLRLMWIFTLLLTNWTLGLLRVTLNLSTCVYAVVKVDRRIRWHYTTTILRLRIGARLTRYQNCKFHNGCPAISRHADGISRYSVPPSAGSLLPLCICMVPSLIFLERVWMNKCCMLRTRNACCIVC